MRGNVKYSYALLDNSGSLIQKTWPRVGMDLRIPIPENGILYFSIALFEKSSVLFREVAINAFSTKILI